VKTARQQGQRLLTRDHVRASIAAVQDQRDAKEIADAVEIDRLLTLLMRSGLASWSERLRAMNELNRVQGRHSIHVTHSGKLTLEQILAESRES